MQLLRSLSGGVRNAVIRLRYCGISPCKFYPRNTFFLKKKYAAQKEGRGDYAVGL